MHWILWQLLSYSVLSWIIFIAIAFGVSRYMPGWWIPLGHIAIAVVVSVLDVRWIQSEISKPGWDGAPDQDIVFSAGVFIRIIAINTVLLPVSALGYWLKVRSRTEVQTNVLDSCKIVALPIQNPKSKIQNREQP